MEDKMATTHATPANLTVKITPNDKGNPPGKLADAELHFGEGVLAGLKLIGFSIWERRGGTGRNVTFPARQYAISGERRSFALLRPIVGTTTQDALRELILEAYVEYEERAAAAERVTSPAERRGAGERFVASISQINGRGGLSAFAS
jgi:hypothetical protein